MVEEQARQLAETIASLADESGRTVGAAESLTGGMVSSALAAAPGASGWYRGTIVAYASEVKFELLDVPEGPVVTREAAEAMATGALALLGADVVVSVTGAGGPEPQDGAEPGTIWVSVASQHTLRSERLQLEGDPDSVCRSAATEVLRLLADELGSR